MFESLFNKAGGLKACIFIKKEVVSQAFSCEFCEIFINSFLVERLLFIILLCDDRIFWTSLDTKLTCFMFLVLIALFSFITLALESGVYSYFVLVFTPKFLLSVTFARITTIEKPETTAEL